MRALKYAEFEHSTAAWTGKTCSVPAGSRDQHSFQLHAIVLCSNSAYFRARITGAVGKTSTGGERTRGQAMEEVMEADECEAAAAVLRFFYTSQLAAAPPGGGTGAAFLLQMMKVADRWQAPLALTALSSVLCKLQPDLFPTAAVYSLLQTSDAFADIRAHACACLLSTYGDAVAVATGHALLASFLQLPHAAVLELLGSGALVTDAEATVLLLLSEWCYAEANGACSEEDVRSLNGRIRYSRLSPPFLTELCESLATPCLSKLEWMELLHFRLLPPCAQASCVAMQAMSGPGGWYAPHRASRGGPAPPVLVMTLAVAAVEVYKLLRAIKEIPQGGAAHIVRSLSTPRAYSHGFLWTLELAAAANGVGVWCGIKAVGVESLLDVSDQVWFDHCVVCSHQLRIVGGADTPLVLQETRHSSPVNSKGLGQIINMREGAPEAALDMQWWQPHVVDGVITFESTLTHIGT
ncbi:MAG: hypothetical protein WDW36_008354 [Sanguina aurantia]